MVLISHEGAADHGAIRRRPQAAHQYCNVAIIEHTFNVPTAVHSCAAAEKPGPKIAQRGDHNVHEKREEEPGQGQAEPVPHAAQDAAARPATKNRPPHAPNQKQAQRQPTCPNVKDEMGSEEGSEYTEYDSLSEDDL